MKKVLFCISICLIVNQSLMASITISDDELECSKAYNSVEESWAKINENKDDLSNMAKKSLYDKLYIWTKVCMDTCKNHEFKYCNNIAKEIEKSK